MSELLQVILDVFQPAWEWAKQYPDLAVFFLGGGISVLGWLSRSFWKQLRRGADKKLFFPDSEPFQMIPPHTASVLQELMPSPQSETDPLADFNILYQQRQEGINVQRELEDCLNETGSLLVIGRTGLGKTREAAELAKVLNNEGWTILKLVRPEILGTSLPKEYLGNKRKLLLFLDDLNQAMYRGQMTEPQDGDYELAPILKMPLQERLQRVLEFLEAECRSSEIRVIATARHEFASENPERPSEWEKLGVKKQHHDFWSRFTAYELPEPEDAAICNTLVETVTYAQIKAEIDNFAQIAAQSDHTFRNIVENLVRIRNRNLQLNINTFLPTLRGTWETRYQAVCKQFPSACYLYDAIDLLQQINVPLFPQLVLAIVQMLMAKAGWQTLWYRWQLPRTLLKVQQLELVLQPRDGQIEAKGYRLNLADYVLELIPIFEAQTKQGYDSFSIAWLSLGGALDKFGHSIEALAAYDAALTIEPALDVALFRKGLVLQQLERHEEAIATYNLALKINPNNDLVLCLKGIALKDLKRYDEALEAYSLAQVVEPMSLRALYGKGMIYSELKRYEEAIAAYDAMLAIDKNDSSTFQSKGIALSYLEQHKEAIEAYDASLKINPNNPLTLFFKGASLSELELYEEAISAYDASLIFNQFVSLALNPDNSRILQKKGDALRYLEHYEEALAVYNTALGTNPNDLQLLKNKGIALNDLGRYEEVIAVCDLVLAIQPNDYETLFFKGTALGFLERYEEAVAAFDAALDIKPSSQQALSCKGVVLNNLGRYEEAIAAYDAALAVEPDNCQTLCNKGFSLIFLQLYENAIITFDTALVVNPHLSEAVYGKGVALSKIEQYDESINCFNRAICIDPNDVSLYFHLAWCHVLRSDTDQALCNLEILFNLDPETAREVVTASQVFESLREHSQFQKLIASPQSQSDTVNPE